MKTSIPVFLCSLISWMSLGLHLEGAAKRSLPPPLKVIAPFESVWKVMAEVIGERGMEIAIENRGQGVLVTEFREYISGPLTEAHIVKIGDKPKLTNANWVRVLYRYEVVMDLLTGRETMITVYAKIRALKREFLGQELWVDIPSNGGLEEALLTDFGKSLFGQSFRLDVPKKGFWERDPEYVPDLQERVPKVVGPERP